MKSIGISFYILPGFRRDWLCCQGWLEWKVERRLLSNVELMSVEAQLAELDEHEQLDEHD